MHPRLGVLALASWATAVARALADSARRTLDAHWLLASAAGCFALSIRAALCASRAFAVQPVCGAIRWLAGKAVLALGSPARAVRT